MKKNIEQLSSKAGEQSKLFQDKINKLAQENLLLKNQLENMQVLIQKQTKALETSRNNIKEDKLIIESMETEKYNIVNHVAELESHMKVLMLELNKYKGKCKNYKAIMNKLSENNKELEEELRHIKHNKNESFAANDSKRAIYRTLNNNYSYN